MELIDDWKRSERIRPEPHHKVKGSWEPAASPKAIGERLEDFKPRIMSVHCYEDVGYPWIQVTFNETINPDVALRVGEALAEAAGTHRVYFNSLRPRAVYFLLEPAFDSKQDLPASRYGTRLAEIMASWRTTLRDGSADRLTICA